MSFLGLISLPTMKKQADECYFSQDGKVSQLI